MSSFFAHMLRAGGRGCLPTCHRLELVANSICLLALRVASQLIALIGDNLICLFGGLPSLASTRLTSHLSLEECLYSVRESISGYAALVLCPSACLPAMLLLSGR